MRHESQKAAKGPSRLFSLGCSFYRWVHWGSETERNSTSWMNGWVGTWTKILNPHTVWPRIESLLYIVHMILLHSHSKCELWRNYSPTLSLGKGNLREGKYLAHYHSAKVRWWCGQNQSPVLCQPRRILPAHRMSHTPSSPPTGHSGSPANYCSVGIQKPCAEKPNFVLKGVFSSEDDWLMALLAPYSDTTRL